MIAQTPDATTQLWAAGIAAAAVGVIAFAAWLANRKK